jgi:hypothetical protein
MLLCDTLQWSNIWVLVILYLNEPREWFIYIYNLYSHNPKYNGITVQEDRRKQFHIFFHIIRKHINNINKTRALLTSHILCNHF